MLAEEIKFIGSITIHKRYSLPLPSASISTISTQSCKLKQPRTAEQLEAWLARRQPFHMERWRCLSKHPMKKFSTPPFIKLHRSID